MRPLALILALCLPLAAPAQSAREYREHIERYEGLSLSPYRDKLGYWTVGVGHRLLPGQSRHRITESYAEALYELDFATAYEGAASIPCFLDLPPKARILVVALVYQLGSAGFADFTQFKLALAMHDYPKAARALRHSRWATQVPERADAYCAILNGLR